MITQYDIGRMQEKVPLSMFLRYIQPSFFEKHTLDSKQNLVVQFLQRNHQQLVDFLTKELHFKIFDSIIEVKKFLQEEIDSEIFINDLLKTQKKIEEKYKLFWIVSSYFDLFVVYSQSMKEKDINEKQSSYLEKLQNKQFIRLDI